MFERCAAYRCKHGNPLENPSKRWRRTDSCPDAPSALLQDVESRLVLARRHRYAVVPNRWLALRGSRPPIGDNSE